ncbi:MAG: nucleotidyl transferase AbiEii/AbiGii toxin family protein [Actinomycetota bacterium]|nr:nucleotidyl transferase AbiEii/AbiGii toxin family protein [Actinomycetota bacterium]
MSIAMLEEACVALGPLVNQVVFLGGATLTLWVTDPGAPPVRPTRDVDVVVEVTTRSRFHAFEAELRRARFDEDMEGGVLCRWKHRDSGLLLDAMPADPRILGFDNRWQRQSLPHAARRLLPSKTEIRAVSPAFLVATKLEAFLSRGHDDYVGSRDFEDVITLVDGRDELVSEVGRAPDDLRTYLSSTLQAMRREARFLDGVFAALRPDAASQARAESVVLPRLDELIGYESSAVT